jgi:sugar/nucleoside kinase (ribokinase family)
MRNGLLAGGNWIRDHVKMIDTWPSQDGLANIVAHTASNGGGPYNLLKDLAKLGAPFPLQGLGLVGDDADGQIILSDCAENGISTRLLKALPDARTSTTDVMTVRDTARRTFFHDRGANAQLGPEHFDFASTDARVFYLGYLLLLDRLDAAGTGGEPAALDVLRRATAAGLLTAVDCVSAAQGMFKATVVPVLPQVDVLFVNDYEAEQITGLSLGRAGALDRRAVEQAARTLVGHGVRQWTILHFPEGVCACSRDGRIVWQPSVRVPSSMIAGQVGAGDALAAGVLYGVHEQWTMERSLELGVCSAAVSLLHATSSESLRPAAQCLEFGRSQGFLAAP